MSDFNLITSLQLAVGIGLLNVWILRPRQSTPFRGGASTSLREEFSAYGLPTWFFFLVGGLKLGAGVALIAGIWVPELVAPSAMILIGLMLGALSMHWKVRDPLERSVPAFLMLAMSLSILGGSI